MNDHLAEAIDDAVKIADQTIPTSFQYIENLRRECAALLEALATLNADLDASVRDTYQWAQLSASYFQLLSCVRGQPIYPEYVQATFDAARRRVLAIADVVTARERAKAPDVDAAMDDRNTTDEQ